MRRVFFLVLAAGILAGPTAGFAQDAPEPGGDGPEASGAAMTELIRQALRDPNAPQSWAGLAQGLSDLHRADGGAGGVSAAIRIADSLAFSPLLSPTSSSITASEGWKAAATRWTSILLSRVGPILPYALALVVLLSLAATGWLPVGGRARRGGKSTRGKSSPRRRGPSRERENRNLRDKRSLALSLLEHGMPANEVARRTGLAQDEVAVALALRGGGTSSEGGNHPLPRSA